jgi:hypothetical protein
LSAALALPAPIKAAASIIRLNILIIGFLPYFGAHVCACGAGRH